MKREGYKGLESSGGERGRAVEAAGRACRLYTTAELTTINPGGFPVTVPVLTAFDGGSGKIVFSTSIAYPAKVRNISRNPDVLFHYHHRVAVDPERQTTGEPEPFLIRAKAKVIEQDFAAALRSIGHHFRSSKTQPGLYKRLQQTPWTRLYRYYFTRMVVEAEPEGVIEGVSLASMGVGEEQVRRPGRRVPLAVRLILRYAPAASVAIADPSEGLSAAEVRVQAALPGLVCAEIPEGMLAARKPGTHAKACLSAFGQGPDLASLVHAGTLGIAEISGRQLRLHPRASFVTIRPPGLVGDAWTGIHSTLRGIKAAADLGIAPVGDDVLRRAFGRRDDRGRRISRHGIAGEAYCPENARGGRGRDASV